MEDARGGELRLARRRPEPLGRTPTPGSRPRRLAGLPRRWSWSSGSSGWRPACGWSWRASAAGSRASSEETQHALERAPSEATQDELRRAREERALLEATQDELRRTRAELDRLRTPLPSSGDVDPVPLAPTLLLHPTPIQFGRYQLLHVLGQGGMATVHLAVSHGAEGFRRLFVVKRLREDVALMPQVVHQFINEARLGASLVHSKIVPIFDFGRVGNEFFLAQEYILGRDLNLLVRRARQHGGAGLPLPAVFHLAHEILDALAYAHSRMDPSGRPWASCTGTFPR